MISFSLSLLALVVGYFVYGKFVDHIFGPDNRETPAVVKADGVDFMILPSWKIFMIQFLNIAGTGPIFGAIMGAWYGPVAYLWIVLGCIFAGAMHDYMSGMLSIRHGGAGLPELVGNYLGVGTKKIMLIFSVVLLLMVGAVFVYSPAIILTMLWDNKIFWIILIFIYYVIATLLPIDKIIGKIYPLFAFSLLFMAAALLVGLFIKQPAIPELWDNLAASNLNQPTSILGTDSFIAKDPIFPCLFITIACGAISGFHATQSPLMARCMKSEKMGRPIFYGSMITEGIVALIWATASMYFFYYGGWKECVDADTLNAFMQQVDTAEGKTLVQYFDAPAVVEIVCNSWLGIFGGILAMFGVVAAPITSGDTALRSARLIVADSLNISQHSIKSRLLIALPIFASCLGILVWQIKNPDGFNVIWQYFGWSNQTLSVFTLWTITVYLCRHHKNYFVSLFPALFMTAVCSTFIFVSPQALDLGSLGYILGVSSVFIAVVWFYLWHRKQSSIFNRRSSTEQMQSTKPTIFNLQYSIFNSEAPAHLCKRGR